MSLASLFSGKDTIKGAFEGVGAAAKDLRETFAGEEHKAKLATLENKVDIAMIELNKLDAQGSAMQRNWRPFLAWSMGCIIVLHYGINPLITWVAALCGTTIVLAQFNVADLWPVILALIGYRSYEKYAGNKKKG